jgi:chitin synthase
MFHSFIQYLFFLPSFTNVLMVYAFCNLHDVSWGTKGDTGQPSKDAAPVKVKQTQEGVMTAVVDLPVNQSDIDAMYEVYLRSVQIKPSNQKSNIDPKQAQEDYFRLFRTRVVMAWVLSNILLIALMTNDTISSALNIVSTSNGLNRNIYLTVMLVSHGIIHWVSGSLLFYHSFDS